MNNDQKLTLLMFVVPVIVLLALALVLMIHGVEAPTS